MRPAEQRPTKRLTVPALKTRIPTKATLSQLSQNASLQGGLSCSLQELVLQVNDLAIPTFDNCLQRSDNRPERVRISIRRYFPLSNPRTKSLKLLLINLQLKIGSLQFGLYISILSAQSEVFGGADVEFRFELDTRLLQFLDFLPCLCESSTTICSP